LNFFKILARSLPDLRVKLTQARIYDDPDYYIKKTANSAIFTALSVCFILFGFFRSVKVILLAPVLFAISFFYFIRFVDAKVQKINKGIAQEIIFAGRFLIIEIESGVPIYSAFINISKNYEVVGPFFYEIVEKVNLGTTMEDALNEAISLTPSPELRKILWQVLNSMKTGANVASSLNSVIDQIVRQQQIDVKEYGRKLNPMAMFYMMMAVIVPSLGTTMLIVLATFIGFALPLSFLLLFALIVGFIQFMFFAVIKSSRPPMEL
jgi:archaeal flagellar protein FlaJ